MRSLEPAARPSAPSTAPRSPPALRCSPNTTRRSSSSASCPSSASAPTARSGGARISIAALLLALACLIPIVVWNFDHAGASLRYNLVDREDRRQPARFPPRRAHLPRRLPLWPCRLSSIAPLLWRLLTPVARPARPGRQLAATHLPRPPPSVCVARQRRDLRPLLLEHRCNRPRSSRCSSPTSARAGVWSCTWSSAPSDRHGLHRQLRS